ncbi:MAG: acetyltransferase, partial [Deltaproteobacteria bacterium]
EGGRIGGFRAAETGWAGVGGAGERRSVERRDGAMARVVIFGSAKMAVMSHFYLTHDSPHEVVAFTVDREFLKEDTVCGLHVVPFEAVERAYPPTEYKMFVAMQFGRLNRSRAEKYQEAKDKGYELISYVSSKAVVWPGLVLGDNCYIGEGSVIQPFVEIGNDVIVACGGIVGHDSVIGDHCFLASHCVVLGCAKIEPYCFLGANSTIVDVARVGRESIVGAGVLITGNTKPKSVYVGKAGELLPKRSDEVGQWLTWPVR